MGFLTIIILIFSILGALDRVLGNRFGLGKEYEKALSVEARELVPTGKQTETPEVEVKTNNKNLWK